MSAETTRSLCTFWLAGQCYGIDVLDVQEVLQVREYTRVPCAPAVVEGLVNLRGLILTTIDLGRRLDLPPRSATTPASVVVVRSTDGAVGLVVDRIGDVVDVGAADFEAAPDNDGGTGRSLVIGAHKLDGVLLLELDTRRTIAEEPTAAV